MNLINKTRNFGKTTLSIIWLNFMFYTGCDNVKPWIINTYSFNSNNNCIPDTLITFYCPKDSTLKVSLFLDGEKTNFETGIIFQLPENTVEFLDYYKDIDRKKYMDYAIYH